MKKRTVFQFNHYKDLLGALLTGSENRGKLSQAATALGCQRSYLSRVLSEEMHLTMDHAFNLAEFLNFDGEEREYFLALVEWERAVSPKYRAHWKAKITALKAKHESIPERTERKELKLDHLEARYFSSWVWSALHFLTSVPEYQSSAAMAQRLGLPESQVRSHLEALSQQGLVLQKGSKWIYQSGEFHAEKDHPFVLLHHQNWRQRALLDAQEFSRDHIHYTAVQSVSRADVEKIKELILECLSEFSRIAGPSKPEDVIALNIDFFKI